MELGKEVGGWEGEGPICLKRGVCSCRDLERASVIASIVLLGLLDSTYVTFFRCCYYALGMKWIAPTDSTCRICTEEVRYYDEIHRPLN